MKLTAKNLKAIEILRTTKEKQCYGSLITRDSEGKAAFCGIGVLLKNADIIESVIGYSQKELHMFTVIAENYGINCEGLENLTTDNDIVRSTFKQMAENMENHPENYFGSIEVRPSL